MRVMFEFALPFQRFYSFFLVLVLTRWIAALNEFIPMILSGIERTRSIAVTAVQAYELSRMSM